jgi:hypothetical protein
MNIITASTLLLQKIGSPLRALNMTFKAHKHQLLAHTHAFSACLAKALQAGHRCLQRHDHSLDKHCLSPGQVKHSQGSLNQQATVRLDRINKQLSDWTASTSNCQTGPHHGTPQLNMASKAAALRLPAVPQNTLFCTANYPVHQQPVAKHSALAIHSKLPIIHWCIAEAKHLVSFMHSHRR